MGWSGRKKKFGTSAVPPPIEVEIDISQLERDMALKVWTQEGEIQKSCPLKDLWTSTATFHSRWKPEETEKRTLQLLSGREERIALHTALNVFREEVSEVIEAANYEPDCNVVEEVADVMVTLIGVLMVRGIGYQDLEEAVALVIEKNNAKTLDTHYVDLITGKIKRREG